MAAHPLKLHWIDVCRALEETGTQAGVARQFGCSETAILRVKRLHRLDRLPMSARKAAARLGRHHRVVTQWLDWGYLRGVSRPDPAKHRARWVITQAALLDFLHDRRYWHLWSPDEIADPRLRRQIDVRRENAPLRVKQVMARFGVSESTVHRWIDRGRLPGQYVAGVWLIEPADVAAFERPKIGGNGHGFTREEDCYIWHSVRLDASCQAVARMLERCQSSIATRYRWLKRHPEYTATLPNRAHRGGMPDCARRSLVARYQAGEDIPRLAWRFGVHAWTVKRVLLAEGMPLRPDPEPEACDDDCNDAAAAD